MNDIIVDYICYNTSIFDYFQCSRIDNISIDTNSG